MWLINVLGPKGIAAVIFVVIMAAQSAMIYSYRNKVQSLADDLAKSEANVLLCNGTLDKQNEAIKLLGTKTEKLQGSIETAKKENIKLEKDLKAAKEDLMKQPLAQTCGEAMSELKRVTKSLSEGWNK